MKDNPHRIVPSIDGFEIGDVIETVVHNMTVERKTDYEIVLIDVGAKGVVCELSHNVYGIGICIQFPSVKCWVQSHEIRKV